MKLVLTGFIVCLAGMLSTAVCADETANREALRMEIEHLREAGRLSIGGVDIATGNALAEFYERRSFSPTWTDIEQTRELLQLVRAAREDGLDPADYHLKEIQQVYDELTAGRDPTPREQAAIDLAFSDALLRLAFHQLYGRVDPANLDARWNFNARPQGPDPLSRLQEAIDASSLVKFADDLFLRGPLYVNLRESLKAHREIETRGGWPPIAEGPTLKVGMNDARVPVLVKRLVVSGDIVDAPHSDSDVYREAIASGVRAFQKRHGLAADGVIGPATLAALNVPVAARIDQLRVNLERARWVLGGLDDDFIIVNIAGFRAYLFRDGETVWETKVQVGTPYHQTPVFRDELSYVVMNPTWTVPYSIATKEMLPKIQQDPAYFESRDFVVRNSAGQSVDPQSIDWHSLSRGNFPYTFVQPAGPGNALGRVKFIFPNEFSVYLHDTPSKRLFGQSARAFSHGCIRTQNPFDLAELLLEDAGWDRERIDAQVESLETKTVYLDEPLAVLLMYWTTDVGPDGESLFYQDVYERDQKVLAALNAPFARALPQL